MLATTTPTKSRFHGIVLGAIVGLGLVLGAASAQAAECVRFAVSEKGGENASVDPTVGVTQGDFISVSALYEPIVMINDDLQAEPRLAESWDANESGTEWTFNLRKGVKFHDGSEMTAKDVVWTYQRVLHPETGTAAKELAFVTPDDVSAVDDYTVTFSLKEPVVEFPLLIANKFAYISKAGVEAEELSTTSYGTGPFKITNFVPNEPRTIFQRNDDYWMEGLPKAKCLELLSISEPLARAAALISGEVDVIATADPKTYELLTQNPQTTLTQSKAGTLMPVSMFIDAKPFDDVKVRQAMKAVVDRQAILDNVLLGYGLLANDNPIAPNSPDAYRSDVKPQDIDKAKALLAEAGHANGIEVDLFTAPILPGTVDLAQAYQQMAAQAGIKVNIINAPAETYWDDVWLKQSFASTFWGARPTSSALSIAYRCGAKYNETHWCREEYDAYLDKANATVDPEERRNLYKKAQELLSEEGGIIAPVFSTLVAGLRANCEGYHPHSDINRAELRYLHCN